MLSVLLFAILTFAASAITPFDWFKTAVSFAFPIFNVPALTLSDALSSAKLPVILVVPPV